MISKMKGKISILIAGLFILFLQFKYPEIEYTVLNYLVLLFLIIYFGYSIISELYNSLFKDSFKNKLDTPKKRKKVD